MSKKFRVNRVLGAYVRSIRQARGIHQTAFCKIIELDQPALSRLENGRQALSAHQLYLLHEHFGLGPHVPVFSGSVLAPRRPCCQTLEADEPGCAVCDGSPEIYR